MLRSLTAGESHGAALLVVLEGLPAGLPLVAADIDRDLARRQQGYGRGGRMQIERDAAELLSGVRHGLTLGSPLSIQIINRDWANWQEQMDPAPSGTPGDPPVTRPRPGHADLAGSAKYLHNDIRNVLERASARETAARVAAGAVARRLLAELGVSVGSRVVSIGAVVAPEAKPAPPLYERAERCDVRCGDPAAAAAMRQAIDAAREAGDSLGGVFEVAAFGVPPGLGSHVQWDRKLDGRLAQALLSIQAIKAVEIGLGFAAAARPGSRVHDPISYEPNAPGWRYRRPTNNAGGIEGGISNGEPIIGRAAMKPIATLYQPLPSVDIRTHAPFAAGVERSDICAVPAAAVVGEAALAWVLADAFLEKLGGDSMEEITFRHRAWLEGLRHA